MKNFHFSLESVLKYKNKLLNNAMGDLGRVTKALNQILEEVKEVQQTYQEQKENYEQSRLRGVTPQVMLYYNDYLNKLHDEENILKRREQAMQREKKAATDKVLSFKVEVAALEKLKEKEWTAYRAQAAKEEERAVEEFVVYGRVASR